MIRILKDLRGTFLVALAGSGVALSACVTTEEELAEGGSRDQMPFGDADQDGDGELSRTELAQHMHKEALAEFDLNNDSCISLHEWSATRQEPESDNDPFGRLDDDGDGEVREDEAINYIAGQAAFEAAFKKLDLDGDNVLVREEYEDGDPTALNISLFSLPGSDPPAEP
jgi:Ca2+-binding EF-hand superfamily protein